MPVPKKPLQDPILYVGIDPGKTGGFALSIEGGPIQVCPMPGNQIPYELHTWAATGKYSLLAWIEHHDQRATRFAINRSKANDLEFFLTKHLFKGRCQVEKVDPRTWQEALGVCAAGSNVEGRMPYDVFAEGFPGVEGRTVDEKAAWCVLMAGLRSRGLR